MIREVREAPSLTPRAQGLQDKSRAVLLHLLMAKVRKKTGSWHPARVMGYRGARRGLGRASSGFMPLASAVSSAEALRGCYTLLCPQQPPGQRKKGSGNKELCIS